MLANKYKFGKIRYNVLVNNLLPHVLKDMCELISYWSEKQEKKKIVPDKNRTQDEDVTLLRPIVYIHAILNNESRVTFDVRQLS